MGRVVFWLGYGSCEPGNQPLMIGQCSLATRSGASIRILAAVSGPMLIMSSSFVTGNSRLVTTVGLRWT